MKPVLLFTPAWVIYILATVWILEEILIVSIGNNRYAEISFSHMMTSLNVDDGSNEMYLFDLGVNYYSIGILQETKPLVKDCPLMGCFLWAGLIIILRRMTIQVRTRCISVLPEG